MIFSRIALYSENRRSRSRTKIRFRLNFIFNLLSSYIIYLYRAWHYADIFFIDVHCGFVSRSAVTTLIIGLTYILLPTLKYSLWFSNKNLEKFVENSEYEKNIGTCVLAERANLSFVVNATIRFVIFCIFLKDFWTFFCKVVI